MTQKFSAARKRAFLTYLSQTGNQTLSAERAKVSRSWVCLHRSTDPEFDAACREAIERARERLEGLAADVPPPLRGHSIDPAGSMEPLGPLRPPAAGAAAGYFDGHELVVRGTGGSGGGKRVQIGRARVKQWTPRVERRFLAALAATCNVKAACREVGLWPPSAYNHRNRWPAFARAWDEAIETGYVRIEASLVEAACNSGRNRTVSQTVRADRFSDPEEVPIAEMPPMTIDQKIHLLHMHKHQVLKLGKAPGLQPRVATEDEVEKALMKALRRTESWLKREEEKKGRHEVN